MKINSKILKQLSQALDSSEFSRLEDTLETLDGDFSHIKNIAARELIEVVYDWWVSSRLNTKQTKEMAIDILKNALDAKNIDDIIKKLQK